MEQELKDNIMGALEDVVDPEIGIDIVNLGLVYDLSINHEGVVTVEMTLTSMGCPMAGQIVKEVEHAVKEIPEVNATNVNLVWSPPWSKDKMSRYAKIALGVHE